MTDEQAAWLRSNEGYEPTGIGGSFAGQGMLLEDGTFLHGKTQPLPPGAFVVGIRQTPQQAADPRKYLNETGFNASANRRGELKVL
jgi:hypothetical protein